MRFTFNKSLLVASVLLAISSQSAFATNGMAPIGLGITQKAMGGAAVATSENTMNAGTNPASLSNVDAGTFRKTRTITRIIERLSYSR